MVTGYNIYENHFLKNSMFLNLLFWSFTQTCVNIAQMLLMYEYSLWYFLMKYGISCERICTDENILFYKLFSICSWKEKSMSFNFLIFMLSSKFPYIVEWLLMMFVAPQKSSLLQKRHLLLKDCNKILNHLLKYYMWVCLWCKENFLNMQQINPFKVLMHNRLKRNMFARHIYL